MLSGKEGREGSNKSRLCKAGLRKHRGIMDNERTKPIVAFPNAFLFSQLVYLSIDQSIHQQVHAEDLLWASLMMSIGDRQAMVPLIRGLIFQLEK